MSDDKKYYYLKLKENYFDADNVKILESMENGHLYSLIIIKLYLKSLKYEGQLKMTEKIPYDPSKISILAKVLNHDRDHVEKAIKSAIELDIIEMFNAGEIFMTEMQNFMGHSSTEADRKRLYRKKLDTMALVPTEQKGQMSGQTSDKSPPELEREKELELELELEREIKRKKEKEEKQKTLSIVLNHWLSKKGLQQHKEITVKKKIKQKHYDIINEYGIEDILRRMDNYHESFSNSSTYDWDLTLIRFLELCQNHNSVIQPNKDPVPFAARSNFHESLKPGTDITKISDMFDDKPKPIQLEEEIGSK